MRPGFGSEGYVPEQDADRQREFRDAVLQVGKEWKEKERDPGCNTTGWKVEVLELWAVMVQEAGGEEAEKLEKYYT
jgi:hypothetical protein